METLLEKFGVNSKERVEKCASEITTKAKDPASG